jgi:O-acetyl-ADP-ribose deacetylase
MTDHFYRGTRIAIVQGDIVDQNTDAIVNAANSSLMGGGGVDGAIHRAGGIVIHNECLVLRRQQYPEGLPVGGAVITSGGNLRARYVIHTVGPVWYGGRSSEKEKLTACYENCLKLAASMGVKSIAFPAISTGAYGYPFSSAAEVALGSVKNALNREKEGYLDTSEAIFKEIRFVLFTSSDYNCYVGRASSVFDQPAKL